MQMDLDRAEHARGVRLRERPLHDRPGLGELAADVDVRHLGADRVCRDRGALEERVRRPPHDFAVLERPGLRLVRVHAEVVRFLLFFRHERPLQSRGEPRAAPPPQSRLLDDVGNGDRVHLQGLRQRFIAATLRPPLERARVGIAEVLREHDRFFGM